MFLLFSKIFSIVLAGVAISKSYVDFRARKESVQMFLLWTMTWIAVVVVALFPNIVDFLIELGGGRIGVGTFLGMALVFNLFLVYRMQITAFDDIAGFRIRHDSRSNPYDPVIRYDDHVPFGLELALPTVLKPGFEMPGSLVGIGFFGALQIDRILQIGRVRAPDDLNLNVVADHREFEFRAARSLPDTVGVALRHGLNPGEKAKQQQGTHRSNDSAAPFLWQLSRRCWNADSSARTGSGSAVSCDAAQRGILAAYWIFGPKK
jgi:hypothetical protein